MQSCQIELLRGPRRCCRLGMSTTLIDLVTNMRDSGCANKAA
jgi:hypothetical protein